MSLRRDLRGVTPPSRSLSARARILGAILAVACIGLAIVGSVTFLVQRERVLAEVNDRLTAQVDRLITVAGDETDTDADASGATTASEDLSIDAFDSVEDYLFSAVARLVPARNEAAVAIIDGEARYRPVTLSGFDISGNQELIDRAIAETAGGKRIVAFAAAVMRERLWFLSMLFVRPGLQGAGLGRALLARVAPAEGEASFRATATDSAQPISNALYASAGIVPRIPLLNFIGLPQDPAAFGTLPSGIVPTAFAQLVGEPGGEGHRRLAGAVDALDREVLGVAHPADHRFLRQENRTGWLYRGPDGATEGYGYASEAGRIGPVAVRDPALLAPILGHLTSAVIPRGAFALWLPGTADRAVVPALRSGFRLDQFPVLLCWDQPFADLTRYLPISPGLL